MKFGWNDDGPKVHRMYQTYQLSQLTHKLDGEWAEVGVFKGATAFLLASLIKDLGLSKKKKIYTFLIHSKVYQNQINSIIIFFSLMEIFFALSNK